MRRLTMLAALIAAGVFLAVAPAIADDHRGDPVIDATGFGEWWYFDPADNLVMTSGEIDWEEWCFGVPPADNIMRSWQQPDGLWTSRITDGRFPIQLYVGSVDDVIGAACGAVISGGEFPQPVAVGSGSSIATFRDQPEPWLGDVPPYLGMHVQNSVRGFVTFDDGSVARVQGSIAYTVVAEGGGPDALAIELLDITVTPQG